MTVRATLGELLEARAGAHPDRPFLVLPEGVRRTYGEFNAEVNRAAHGLAALGIGAGDHVAIMLPNGLEFLWCSYALKKLGAVEVAINTHFRAQGLAHLLRVADAATVITDADHVVHLDDVLDERSVVRRVLIAGREVPALAHLDVHPLDAAIADRTDDPGIAVRDDAPAAVLFTSGTTGPSKGCVLSHRYAVRCGDSIVEPLRLHAGDCLYSPFPLYHLDAAFLTVVPALLLGARAAIGLRFSASRFWAEVRELDATVFDFMGATLAMLRDADPRDDDADNPTRLAWGVPMPPWRAEFEQRFGLRLAHCYGLTDAGMLAWERPDGDEPEGSCGRVLADLEVAILDEEGERLPPGVVGEIAVRPQRAHVVMEGYLGMPAATLETFRGLWLHTGDLGRVDQDGHLFFAGRRKDAIRRRGENISAWEIEMVVDEHPAVVESAAVGVPSPLSEEDVKLFCVLRPGSNLDPDSVRAWCRDRMAKHMVPAFVEFVDALPKTPTGKIAKHELTEALIAARPGRGAVAKVASVGPRNSV
jgi:carnitine-CoA ligase